MSTSIKEQRIHKLINAGHAVTSRCKLHHYSFSSELYAPDEVYKLHNHRAMHRVVV